MSLIYQPSNNNPVNLLSHSQSLGWECNPRGSTSILSKDMLQYE
ncbi:hypothetical protein [Dolichospermum sp. UHCC 0259]|nr:hypothetical protein [Dolichospermum sp. UHCC 0259]